MNRQPMAAWQIKAERERAAMHRGVEALDGLYNRLIGQAGPCPGSGRIVAENGGFALQAPALMLSGRWEWKREAWGRDRRDMVEAARLRGIKVD